VCFLSWLLSFTPRSFASTDTKAAPSHDGIDKRMVKVKQQLAKILSAKEMKALAFARAVVHTNDSTAFYAKIPFADTARPGFVLVKKQKDKIQYVQVNIQNYHCRDTFIYDMRRPVVIASRDKKLNKKFTMNVWGRVDKMAYLVPKNGIRDTAFSFVPFMVYDMTPGKPQSYINMNFVFDPIDSLNYHKLHTKVLVHDLITLSFKNEDSFEIELGNSDILPAIDLKKMLGAFGSPPDSLKKQ
jgi:hypothetical protein